MTYQAEIFDRLQYLYQITGFNDHQVHCIIRFSSKVNAVIMNKAVTELIRTVPMLSRVYRDYEGKSYWENTDTAGKDAFIVVYTEEDFERFTVYNKTDEKSGPQIKVCLLQSEKDALSVILNHMVTDGAGLKQCVYLLSKLYSHILEDPEYKTDYIIDGDRSFKNILSRIPLRDKLKILILQNKENNQSAEEAFPMSSEDSIAPFLLTQEISQDRFHRIHNYCKEQGATVNDFILTAYFRVLSKMLKSKERVLSIPIMIDMRRYLSEKSIYSLANLSSTVIIRTAVLPGESFQQTLSKVSQETRLKKEHFLGLNTFLKLDLLNKILGKSF